MKDFRLTADNDLMVKNGDFVIGDATEDNQRLLILAEKGSLRHAPTRGVGIRRYLQDENPREMLRSVRKELTRDGMKVTAINYHNGKLKIDADYA